MNQMPVNFEEVLSRLEGDQELLLDIFGIFLDKAPDMLSDLKGIDIGGHASVATCHLVHDVKGMAANIGAEELKRLAQQYEARVRQPGDDDILLLRDGIAEELGRVCRAVEAYCRSNGTGGADANPDS